jgi:hypothetical protein
MKSQLAILIAFVFLGCQDAEDDFPKEPYIEFRSFSFGKSGNTGADSLNLEFYFRDGDGDLGLNNNTDEPYNKKFYFLRSDGTKISDKVNLDNLLHTVIRYQDKRTQLDTLPEFTSPFSCTNWEIFWSVVNTPEDTVYYQANENYYNLFVDVFTLRNETWEKLDFNLTFSYPFCTEGWPNARFESIKNTSSYNDTPFTFKNISSKEGIIIYSIRSPAIQIFFSGQKIKLKVKIQDRALNRSNEIETTEIQF